VSAHESARLARAAALAGKGRYAVEPNPCVGCVIEKDGGIVGEGWHEAYGGPHAEAVALARAGDAARGATAFVSLEPCCAAPGKKTPPCADALARAGVRRVVYGAIDPDARVNGRGAARLAELGVEVLRLGGAAPPRPPEGRPWVILKWAMSWDGRTSPAAGVGGTLVGERALAFVHELRGRSEAVAVGVETVLADDPRLTCRLEGGPPDGRPQPLRVVFDSTLRTPPAARLLRDGAAPTLVVATREGKLEGAEVWSCPGPDGRVDLRAALHRLQAERGVRRMLVEGGSRIHGALLRAGLADQVDVLLAPRILGGTGAPPAVEGTGFRTVEGAPRLLDVVRRPLGDDLLLRGTPAPSAPSHEFRAGGRKPPDRPTGA
jgi:diaminohydroxyphosphoribosylaminopyrimidine deaminase/5-amino-6-(5-phosphoribosylamino)uracil reductase